MVAISICYNCVTWSSSEKLNLRQFYLTRKCYGFTWLVLPLWPSLHNVQCHSVSLSSYIQAMASQCISPFWAEPQGTHAFSSNHMTFCHRNGNKTKPKGDVCVWGGTVPNCKRRGLLLCGHDSYSCRASGQGAVVMHGGLVFYLH